MKNRKYLLICLLLSIVLASTLVFVSLQEKKWLVAFILAVIGIFGCFVIQKKLWQISLIVLVFLIPLRIDFYLLYKQSYFVSTAYPGFPVTTFDVVLIVLIGYWFLQLLRGEEKFYFYPSISIPAIVYLILSGISASYSADLSLSLALFLLIIKSYIVFLYIANRIKTREDISSVVLAITFGVLLQSLVGILQYVSEGSFLQGVFGVPATSFMTQVQGKRILSRVGGTIGHPNELARYLCFCIPVLVSYVFAKFNPSIKKLALYATMAGSITLMLTLSRGCWLALGLTSIFLFYEIFRCYLRSRLKSIVMVILCLGILVGATLAVFEDVRIRLFEQDYGRAEARIPMAMVALNIIKAHPIGGVGLNNYTVVMQAYDRTREWQTYEFPHPVHNSYLLIAAESGIPALVAFLWFIGAVFTKAWPALKSFNSPASLLQIGWMGGLLTWLVAGMFHRDFAGTNVMLWFTLSMIIATGRVLSIEHEKNIPQESQ